jgi:hypothetical protein
MDNQAMRNGPALASEAVSGEHHEDRGHGLPVHSYCSTYRAARNRPLTLASVADVLSRLGHTATSTEYVAALCAEWPLSELRAHALAMNAANDPACPVTADVEYGKGGEPVRAVYRRVPSSRPGVLPDRRSRLADVLDDRDAQQSPHEHFADLLARCEPVTERSTMPPGGSTAPALHVVPERRSRLKTAADRRDRPDPVWTVAGVLPEVGVGQLYGPSYAGKSYAVADLTLRLCNGLPDWFGQQIRRSGPVVSVLMEGAWGYPRRVEAWLAGHPGTSDEALFTLEDEPLDLRDASSVARLVEDVRAAEIDPVLVTVDTQSLATPGTDENSNTDMTQVFANCKRLSAELRCFVLLVHHTGHDKSRARGASAQFANLDAEIAVQPGTLQVTKVKEGQRWQQPRGFRFVEAGASAYVEPVGLFEALAEQHSGDRPDLSARILAAVAADPGLPLRDLKSRAKGGRVAVDRALDDLLDAGQLREETGPRGARRFYLGAD